MTEDNPPIEIIECPICSKMIAITFFDYMCPECRKPLLASIHRKNLN